MKYMHVGDNEPAYYKFEHHVVVKTQIPEKKDEKEITYTNYKMSTLVYD